MQSWIDAQRRYCAGPRLDCARDASLEHQQNHGAARKQGDEDMTTLDMTKNIAYMHICQVISSANYSIIYLYYPEQKYFTHLCFV